MPTMKTPGSRVFAVLSANDTTVSLLGFGTYVGDEVPPTPVGMYALFAETWEEWDNGIDALKTPHITGLRPTNCKIVLDDGEVVWGAECWWGPEETYATFRGDRTETRASIIEVRKASK